MLQDFLEVMRPFAPDPAAYDAFTRQWFFEVVLPEYRLHEAEEDAARASNGRSTVRLENAGSGTMPVEIAAIRGQRFDRSGSASPDYREARATVTLGKGESKERHASSARSSRNRSSSIPMRKVLQLQRKAAIVKF